jgi:Domain of unknown function (DUF4380)
MIRSAGHSTNFRSGGFLVLLLWISLGSCRAEGVESHDGPTLLANGGTTVGIQPEIGDRIALLKFHGGPNLIPEAPRPWSWRPEGWPRPPLDYPWSQDYGQVVWAGPQDSWWADQDVLPAKHKDVWPPDPDWTLAEFTIMERTTTKLVAQSPVSRLNGLQLTKTVECLSDGKVKISAVVRNCGTKTLKKDIWFVFRAPFDNEEFVPIRSAEDVRLLQKGGDRFLNGMHTLRPSPPEEGKNAGFNKAFIDPAAGWIAITYRSGFLILRFRPAAREQVVTGHAPVEVYRLQHRDGSTLLEIEQHSPVSLMAPGAAIEDEQTWEFLSYDGEDTSEARSRFLKDHLQS